MINKEARKLVHQLQKKIRSRLEMSSWSKGVAMPNRIVEGARPAQLRASTKLLAQRALAYQRRLRAA